MDINLIPYFFELPVEIIRGERGVMALSGLHGGTISVKADKVGYIMRLQNGSVYNTNNLESLIGMHLRDINQYLFKEGYSVTENPGAHALPIIEKILDYIGNIIGNRTDSTKPIAKKGANVNAFIAEALIAFGDAFGQKAGYSDLRDRFERAAPLALDYVVNRAAPLNRAAPFGARVAPFGRAYPKYGVIRDSLVDGYTLANHDDLAIGIMLFALAGYYSIKADIDTTKVIELEGSSVSKADDLKAEIIASSVKFKTAVSDSK